MRISKLAHPGVHVVFSYTASLELLSRMNVLKWKQGTYFVI